MKHLSVFRRWMHTVRQLRLALLGLTLLFVTLVFSTLDFTLQLNRYTIASSQDSLQNTARSSIATLESYLERQLSYVQRAATAIASLPEGSSEAEVRQLLVQLAPAPGMPVRLGGDEFLVLLPGADWAQAEALAGRICDRLPALASKLELGVPVGVSVGVHLPFPGSPAAGPPDRLRARLRQAGDRPGRGEPPAGPAAGRSGRGLPAGLLLHHAAGRGRSAPVPARRRSLNGCLPLLPRFLCCKAGQNPVKWENRALGAPLRAPSK